MGTKTLSFYVHSTDCVPMEGSDFPRVRGRGIKTYLHFSENGGKEDREKALLKIPGYEQPTRTRTYHNNLDTTKHTSTEFINKQFLNCRRCTLHNHRTQIVFGRGSSDARIVLIGQSPGNTEDLNGLAFTGPSGNMLEHILEEAKFSVPYFIDNMVCCSPSDGPGAPKRDEPRHEECIACSSRMWAVLSALKPNVVIALGRVAASLFWENPKDKPRNELIKTKDRRILVGQTYHPAYLLRAMQKGGLHQYKSMIEFFKTVQDVVVTLNPIGLNEAWSLGLETGLKYLEGIFK